jgi:hypothetical protein
MPVIQPRPLISETIADLDVSVTRLAHGVAGGNIRWIHSAAVSAQPVLSTRYFLFNTCFLSTLPAPPLSSPVPLHWKSGS